VPSSSNYQHMRGMYEGMLGTSAGQANAQHLANGQIMHQLQSQSVSLAYIDVFWLLFFASLIMIPMSFLLQKNNPKSGGGEPVAAH
jgi:DHA2 family multidrug resistance protein